MARVYLNLTDLKPVQLASKAQFVIQKMRASNYCDNPPVSYQDVDAKIELLMNYIIQEDMGEKGATKDMNKLVEVLEHILKTYVEYVQMQSHGDERIIIKCGMTVKNSKSKVSNFASLKLISKNLKALSLIAVML